MLSYVLKTGFKNLGNKKLFSFASIGTIACSVLVFCIFFVIATNIRGLIDRVETTVGIQVFFDSNLSEEEIQELANNYFIKVNRAQSSLPRKCERKRRACLGCFDSFFLF